MAKSTKKSTRQRLSAARSTSTRKDKTKKPAPRKPNRASALQKHFEKAGVRFDLNQNEIVARLRQLMGRKRHSEWHTASTGRQEGWGRPEGEYELLRSAEEINTLFSLQAHVSLKVCEWLSTRVAASAPGMARIGDLGCGSGVLAAWLAKQYPECSVTGWDAIKTMIEAASASQIAPKLTFATWNYAKEPCPEPNSCDVLVSCFGIDFPIDEQSHRQSLDVPTLRRNNYYHKMLGVLQPYFHHWRTAIRDQGVLHAVLRIPSPVLFLATVDAAHHEGWTLDAGLYEYLTVGVESFPAMTLKAASGPVIMEDLALSLWSRHALRATFAEPITDPAAACVFHSLADRVVLKTATRTYDDGHTMQAIVGTAGFLGFQYTHATTGFGRLKLMSLDDVERAEPWFPDTYFGDW